MELQKTKRRRRIREILLLYFILNARKNKYGIDYYYFDKRFTELREITALRKEDVKVEVKVPKNVLEEYYKLKTLQRREVSGRIDISGTFGGVTRERARRPIGTAGGELTVSAPVSEGAKGEEEVREVDYDHVLSLLRGLVSERTKEDIRKIAKLAEKRSVLTLKELVKGAHQRELKYFIYEFPDTIVEVFGRKIPTCSVEIVIDEEKDELQYVFEDLCRLTPIEREYFIQLRDAIEETPGYIASINEMLESEVMNKLHVAEMYIVNWADSLWDLIGIPIRRFSKSYFKIIVQLLRDLVGYKKLNPLFYDKENIEDISYVAVNSPVRVRYRLFTEWLPVYIKDAKGRKRPLTFRRLSEANEYVRLLVQKTGEYVNMAFPMVDGRLPDNSRLHAKYGTTITSPDKGPTFTIRLKSEKTILPLHLINWRTASPELMAFAWMTTEIVSTASTIIAGTTGVGKTTTLQSILHFVPPTAKILSIEETPELRLPHPHWEPVYTLETGTSERKISMFDLVKGALRERPDYIVVQEVRGQEAMDMFHAMASGHASLSTMHAGSFEEVIKRLTSRPINVPEGFVATTLKQVWIQLIVPSEVKGFKVARKVVQVWEVSGTPDGKPIGYKLFTYNYLKRLFEPTPEFAQRLYDENSIFFQVMVQNGFDDQKELLYEFTMRSRFLKMLSEIFKVYENYHTLKAEPLSPDQQEAVEDIMNFWRAYEDKAGARDLSKMFFLILFDYKNKKQTLTRVIELYSLLPRIQNYLG